MKKKLLCALVTFVAVIGLFLISALAGGGASSASDSPSYVSDNLNVNEQVVTSANAYYLINKTLTLGDDTTLPEEGLTFNFTLTDANDTTADAPTEYNGSVSFTEDDFTGSNTSVTKPVKFLNKDNYDLLLYYGMNDNAPAQTYTYTVKETVSTTTGVTSDDSVYTMKVEVSATPGEYTLSKAVSFSKNDSASTEVVPTDYITFTNTYAETPKVVEGLSKTVVTQCPSEIDITGVSYPKEATAGGKTTYTLDMGIDGIGHGTTLMYAITVTGEAGAKFTVTDDDTTLVHLVTDEGASATQTTVSGGGTAYTGKVGSKGSTTFYVTKHFGTITSLTLTNTATCNTNIAGSEPLTATCDVDLRINIDLTDKIQKQLTVASDENFEGETFNVTVTEAVIDSDRNLVAKDGGATYTGSVKFEKGNANSTKAFVFDQNLAFTEKNLSERTGSADGETHAIKYVYYLIKETAGTTDGMNYDNVTCVLMVWMYESDDGIAVYYVMGPTSSVGTLIVSDPIIFQNYLGDPVTFYPDAVTISEGDDPTHLFYKKLTLDEDSDETESLDDVFDFKVTITPTEAAELAGYTGGAITGIAGEVAVTEDNSASDDSGKFVTFTDEDDALVGLTFTKPGSYTFTVAEVDTDEDGVTYDDTEYTLTVVVAQNETTKALEVASWTVVDADDEDATAAAQTITFRNTYLYEEDEEELPPRPTFRPTTTVTTDPTVKVKGLDTVNHVNYIVGVGDGLVNPLGTITRAEAANIFFRLMTEEWRELYWSDESSFADVDGGKWYSVAVATLEKAGVLTDTAAGGLFRPNEPITRAELAVMAAQFCTITGKIPAATFKDVDKSHWAYDEICLIEYAGWIEGDGKGNFMPDALLSRAECVTIVNRMLTRGAEPENMTEDMVTFTDNADESKWYYAAVQEAANAHEYVRTGKKLTDEDFKGERWTKTLPATDWAALELAWAQEYGKN